MIFDERDVVFEAFSGSGPGGQYRNRHANCCRATHVPTGIVATASSERSLRQNKANALANLKAKLAAVVTGIVASRKKARHDDKPDAAYGHAVRVYRLCGRDQGVIDRRVPGRSWPISVLTRGDLDDLLDSTREK
jgi:protein subunit release factor A